MICLLQRIETVAGYRLHFSCNWQYLSKKRILGVPGFHTLSERLGHPQRKILLCQLAYIQLIGFEAQIVQ